ncbi:Non-canonical purine NTP pyrophosphatase, RdgB/HAM1 family [Lactobacillus equicursoris DSM 19284 = JCM 14600 = CIP 110162]|uniref:dITP/XTP pyrophosphatase n=3 Tax=Lactobacillus equicursoris TaxID=420645 RepID=K0NX98_9LACO|nr:XTP/dITP diphosphatase [Lactobacillus equicursoris]KRL00396.1 nucleoside-triphosphatase [Lactobacillus equicursoris DSM 19284 = JCM 14600 = CIP 110162]MDD6406868.1 XTP/dITP diphosphatase [Lactobacillus equicursoris]MST79987.1 XTP/dITP diphosphatase [Lactobacillus equicursoris]CCK83121.1 Non-canonical purine NTP pyrophosphatase, RdgB/HAM1 family [Lactobacillus equicursoris 66c]CCK85676.1 Non-canonical purine NTP pyrophosphatase, RdgB/HAM1 family [Lactobacillus equicursoris DSM 19284 = JCM 14
MTQVLLFATNNQNKVKELQSAFDKAGLDIELKSNADLENPPYVNEKGETFEANAALKAHALAEYSKLPTLADDSGLRVDKLNGAPGVHSARYGGEAHNDARNNAKLLAALGGVPLGKRTARFESVLVLTWPGQEDKDLVVKGVCEGEVLAIPRGDNGFGYDPLFYVPSKDKTFAQMTTEEKNEVSHRGKAVKALIEKLPAWLAQFN